MAKKVLKGFDNIFHVFRCLLGTSPALFVALASASLLCRVFSRRCSYFPRCENGRHALRPVKTYERQ